MILRKKEIVALSGFFLFYIMYISIHECESSSWIKVDV